MNTAGFYKILENNLQYQPTFVYEEDFSLWSGNYLIYAYPLGGWYWFDSEEQAKLFFNKDSV
jgi:hypothetical protein